MDLFIAGHFLQISWPGGREARGEFYLQSDKLLIQVDSPVQQVIFFRDDTMFLFYPNDKKAFAFYPSPPASHPITRLLWPLIPKDSLNLLEDTPKKKVYISKNKKVILVEMYRWGHPYLVEAKTKDESKTLYKYNFYTYEKVGNTYVPVDFKITVGESVFQYKLSNLSVSKGPPEDFRWEPSMPEGVKVKKQRW